MCGCVDVSERRGVVWISRELPEGEDVEVCVARCVDLKETFKKDRDEPRHARIVTWVRWVEETFQEIEMKSRWMVCVCVSIKQI